MIDVWHNIGGVLTRRGRSVEDDFIPYVTIPDDTNCGCDTSLLNGTYSGPTTITAAGTIIENKTINDRLIIQAADVQVINCMDQAVGTSSQQYMINTASSSCTNFQAYRTTFQPATLNYWTNSIYGSDFIMERCLVRHTVDGCSPVPPSGGLGLINGEVKFCRMDPLAWFYEDESHTDGTHNDGVQMHGGGFFRIHGSALYGYKYNALGTPTLDGSENNRHPQIGQIHLEQHGIAYTHGYLAAERTLDLDAQGFPIISTWGGAPIVDHNWIWGGDNGVKAMSNVSFGSQDGLKVDIAMWVLSNTWMDYPRVHGSFPYPIRVDTNAYVNGTKYPATTGRGWTESTTPAFDFGNRYSQDASIPVAYRGLSVGLRVDAVAASVARA
jgi:hypothetical protein